MTLSADEIAALEKGPPRMGLFLRLAVDPVLRLWLGIGPIDPGINTLDPAGVLYRGYGELLDVPAFDQLVNGAFERLELNLSGTDDRITGLATFANEVQGKRCSIGFGLLGDDWQMLGPVHWARHYVADYLRMTVTPAPSPDEQTTKTATLSVGSMMTGRRRPGLSYFTDQDQQLRSPGDRFCERTPLYSELGQKLWPRFA